MKTLDEEIKSISEKHQSLLEKWFNKYKGDEVGRNEFTWDGPSDWHKWMSQKRKILFLLKEARSEFQPSVKGQKIENKTGRNIARWKLAITKIAENPGEYLSFPSTVELPADYSGPISATHSGRFGASDSGAISATF